MCVVIKISVGKSNDQLWVHVDQNLGVDPRTGPRLLQRPRVDHRPHRRRVDVVETVHRHQPLQQTQYMQVRQDRRSQRSHTTHRHLNCRRIIEPLRRRRPALHQQIRKFLLRTPPRIVQRQHLVITVISNSPTLRILRRDLVREIVNFRVESPNTPLRQIRLQHSRTHFLLAGRKPRLVLRNLHNRATRQHYQD